MRHGNQGQFWLIAIEGGDIAAFNRGSNASHREMGTDHVFLLRPSASSQETILPVVGRVFGGAAGEAAPGAPADRGGDLALKPLAPQNIAAIGRRADLVDQRRVGRLIEQGAIAGRPGRRVAPERENERVRRYQGVGALPGVGEVARPGIVRRRLRHPRPHRVHLDIAAAGEELA